jgi:hypothetical protein
MDGAATATAPMPPVDWSMFPGDSWPFFLIALGLSLLVGMAEVAGAFRDKAQAVKAVLHRWALPYYGLYLLLTYLIGRILLEYTAMTPSWTAAVILGILGPSLFKTQIKLFKPLAGAEGLNASLERALTGVQQFCFEQISLDLIHRRIGQKLALNQVDESRLEKLVEAIYGDEQYQKTYKSMIDDRRQHDPRSLRALLVALIEKENPAMLEQLESEPPGHQPTPRP